MPPLCRICPVDTCASGFETDPGSCFDDPDNNFQLVTYNDPFNAGTSTFTVPPPPVNPTNNNVGAAVTTPTEVNTFRSIIYNNTIGATGQVLRFLLYVCVPDGTTDDAIIATALFDTLIEVDLLDAVGNVTSVLFTATIENTINEADLTCIWNTITAPVGQLLPLGSPFKVSHFVHVGGEGRCLGHTKQLRSCLPPCCCPR